MCVHFLKFSVPYFFFLASGRCWFPSPSTIYLRALFSFGRFLFSLWRFSRNSWVEYNTAVTGECVLAVQAIILHCANYAHPLLLPYIYVPTSEYSTQLFPLVTTTTRITIVNRLKLLFCLKLIIWVSN